MKKNNLLNKSKFKLFFKKFGTELLGYAALIFTHCEGLYANDHILNELKEDEYFKTLEFGYGIHFVGFPLLTNIKSIFKEPYEKEIEASTTKILDIIMKADKTLNITDIFKLPKYKELLENQKMGKIKNFGRINIININFIILQQ